MKTSIFQGKKIKRALLSTGVVIFAAAACLAQVGRGVGSLTGVVVNESGTPIPGASIWLELNESQFRMETVSDKNGVWRFIGLGTGTFKVTVVASGYIKFRAFYSIQQLGTNPVQRIVLKQKKTSGILRVRGNAVGYTILNDLISLFETQSDIECDPQEVIRGLNHLYSQVQVARKEKVVNEDFCERFCRILWVCRLTMLQGKNEDEPLVSAAIVAEVNRFENVETMKTNEPVRGLGSVAGVIAAELINLKKMLDRTSP